MSPTRRIARFSASFRFRLFIIFTTLTALVICIFTILYIVVETREQRSHAVGDIRLHARHLAETARLPLYAEDTNKLLELARELARLPEIRKVTISSSNHIALAEAINDPSNEQAGFLTETAEVRSIPFVDSPETALAERTDASGVLIGYVRIERGTRDLAHKMQQAIATACFAGVVFWLVVSGLSYLALRQVTRSFNALVRGIGIMREGDFTTRIDVRSNDEPGRAALAINELAASLQERQEENRRLQQELVNAMRLEVQEEKNRLMAQLIQTNRLTALGLLVSSIGHEINTPNGAIKLAGQQIAKTWKSAIPILDRIAGEEGDFVLGGVKFSQTREEIARAAEVIVRCSDRIGKTIQNLRDYNVGERSGTKRRVQINQVVVDALTIIRAQGRYANICVRHEPGQDLPTVTGNRYQLEQVIINLLLNGMQSIGEGINGFVNIATGYEEACEEVVVSIKDNGEGIDAETMKSLLEPFFSTRTEKGGSGLGLYISNFIIKEHKGRLEFKSEPGHGTIATICLPADPCSS